MKSIAASPPAKPSPAGSHTATILHTPGHTEGSICLYFPAQQKLIAGDTLFAGSIGRTDLTGGSMQKIMRSLHDTVMALPDETVVVPGSRQPHHHRRRARIQSVLGETLAAERNPCATVEERRFSAASALTNRTVISGFLGGAKKNLAHERLRRLRYQHGHGVGHVRGLKHFVRVLAFVRAEFGFG